MRRAVAILVRNTTWKCGRVERLVVNHLQKKLQLCGRAQTPIKDMMEDFNLKGKQKTEFLEALNRLERRQIIKIISARFSSPPELGALSRQGVL